MNRVSALFWVFLVAMGVFFLNQAGQWAGGQSWYREETLLISMFALLVVYLMLAAILFEFLFIILCAVGLALYVAVPSVAVFFAAYFLAANVPTLKEMAILSLFIFIFSVAGGLIRQGQIDKRHQLPEV